jgi:non-specific serine/threonine protein kinase
LVRARALLEEGLALARAVGEPRPVARLLRHLTTVAMRTGQEDEARRLRAEGLAAARRSGDAHELTFALVQRAFPDVRRGDLAAARALIEEGLPVARAAGDRMASSVVLGYLASLRLATGDVERGESLAEESLALARTIGFIPNIIGGLGLLGDAARLRNHYNEAGSRYRESLRRARDLGDRSALALAAIRLAGLWAAQGRSRPAARLFGAVERWRGVAGAGRGDLFSRERHDRDVAATRTALGEAIFDAAWAEGLALPLEVAAAEALALEPPAEAAVGGSEPTPGPLTVREREVAGLIAQGQTNRQIGVALSISPNTVERHVENILNKLGLTSRSQIAAWAVTHGLPSPSA